MVVHALHMKAITIILVIKLQNDLEQVQDLKRMSKNVYGELCLRNKEFSFETSWSL